MKWILLVILVTVVFVGSATGSKKATFNTTEKTFNVLVVMPSQVFLRLDGGSMVRVGSYLDETMVPIMTLMKSGYPFTFTFTTPQGNKPSVDPMSNSSFYFSSPQEYQEALELWDSLPSLQAPVMIGQIASESPTDPIDQVNTRLLSTFDALFIPGGHAPIIDLWSSTAAARILNWFQSNNLVIGSICHGPMVLASTSLLPNGFLFRGYNLTVFSTAEENVIQAKWGASMGFYPQDVLSSLGAFPLETAAYAPNVVVDRNLVTGQNPQSAALLGSIFLQTILQFQ